MAAVASPGFGARRGTCKSYWVFTGGNCRHIVTVRLCTSRSALKNLTVVSRRGARAPVPHSWRRQWMAGHCGRSQSSMTLYANRQQHQYPCTSRRLERLFPFLYPASFSRFPLTLDEVENNNKFDGTEPVVGTSGAAK